MVAELAGVSTATVSYVFSGRHGGASGAGVAAETAQRVREAADRLNYRPNRAARAVRTGRTDTVQLSLPMMSDPWSQAVADAVNAEAKRQGLITLILADGDWDTALDRIECDVAYVDEAPDTAETRRKLAGLVERGQRLVVFSEHLEPAGYDVIRSDALPGCEMAMAHLLESHRRIGCLAPESSIADSAHARTRYSVYLEGLRSHGIEPDPVWTEGYGPSPASAFAAAVRLLSQADRPSAIFATTDFAGIAAINAAHMLGLRVPGDIAVIGVGNTPDAATIAPTLTTVGPTDFFEQQARIIVARALADDDEPARLHEFAWSLHPGGSTAIDALDVRVPL